MFRLHGSGRAGTHTPWSYDAQTASIYNALSRLHLEAVPLIMSLWNQAAQTGLPPTRPLWLQYPNDPTARVQDQEWLLGSDVLVAPVVTQGAVSRSVYFPAGCWRDPQTGQRFQGPATVTVTAPLQTLPYYFHCGTAPFSISTHSAVRGCPVPPGRLAGTMLGPLHLGMTRARAGRALPRTSRRTTRDMDFFCLTKIGIRAAYPSARLLHSLARAQRNRVRGRIVLALTANPYYKLRGVRPGARLRAVARRLGVGPPRRIGLNTWYLCPDGPSRGVLKVRHGIVEEIGIADKRLTNSRPAALRFLDSFG